jgi:hypothetical protein
VAGRPRVSVTESLDFVYFSGLIGCRPEHLKLSGAAMFRAFIEGRPAGGFVVIQRPDAPFPELHTHLENCGGGAGLAAWRKVEAMLKHKGYSVLTTFAERANRRAVFAAVAAGFVVSGSNSTKVFFRKVL